MVAKTRQWEIYANRGPFIGNVPIQSYVAHWDTSPRSGGRLVLRANGYNREHFQNLHMQYDGKGADPAARWLLPGSTTDASRARASCYSDAYGRFRGRLYKGSASLGVTLGSYQQSREMIVSRSRSITRQAEEILSDLGRRHQVRGRALRRLSSNYLEVVFGWVPLLKDIKAACDTVIQLADRVESVRGTANRSYVHRNIAPNGDGTRVMTTGIGGNVSITVASLVTISNPNRWLAERAGLLNIGATAWDKVPWSFVVNMFANTGQLVNSITDFAGLSFQNQSVTTTYRESGSQVSTYDYRWVWPPPGGEVHSVYASSWRADRKIRSVGDIPRPSLVFKVPNANWELAAIASSLMVQKVSQIGAFFGMRR